MKSLAPPYQNVVSVAYKPSSVIGGHLSRPIVTDGFKRNPESIDGPSQSLFRFLLRAGFTSRTSRQAAGELLPHLSTLTSPAQVSYPSLPPRESSLIPPRLLPRSRGIEAVYLCCTFPRVAPGGCYPLSLPCGARTFLTGGPFAPPARLSSLLARL